MKEYKKFLTVSKLSPSPLNSTIKSYKQIIPLSPKCSSTILFEVIGTLLPSILPKHLLYINSEINFLEGVP